MGDDVTTTKRPVPPRPANGLLAWQSTLGFISNRLSPDAVLKFEACSNEARVQWSATVSWSGYRENVAGRSSLATALSDLWVEVSRHQRIFDRVEDAVRSPQNYDESEWMDMNTQESLQRLVWVTQSAFPGDWELVMVYQPVDLAENRMQARLLVKSGSVVVGGRGPSLLEACRTLFRNATPHYAGQSAAQA